MQHLKRNWRIMTVVALLITGGGLWLGLGVHGRAVADPEPPESYDELSQAQRDAILGVMEDVALDRDALVALNLTGEQAEDLVAATRQWCSESATTLANLRATTAGRTSELRALRAAIRMGPAQAGQDEALATAIADLLAARAAYRTALGSLRTGVAADLSETQEAAWASVERGHSQRMPIRLLDLGSEQRLAISGACRAYRLAYAAATSDQDRQTARSTWAAARASILTEAQEDLVDAYLGYWVASSETVAEALDTVLPLADA